MPPAWRREHGRAAERLVADMLADRSRSGRSTGIGFWGALAFDTARHAVLERVGVRAGARRGRTDEGESSMRALVYDIRYAVRSLSRQPAYAITVVAIMMMAVAANTAVFRVYDGLFVRSLPFEDAGRLVDLDTRAPQWNLDFTGMAYADFAAWRDGNRTFESMAVYDVGGASLQGVDGATRVSLVRASHDLATTLGIEPVEGRLFNESEDVPDGPLVALLGHGLWVQAYGRDPSVVGGTVTLDDRVFQVLGVIPPEASFVEDADLWVPLQEDPGTHDAFSYQGVGRLLPGVTLSGAEEDLTRVHKSLVDRWSVNEVTFPVVSSLRERYLGDARTGLHVLVGAVGVILLLACANIAGLTLVRALGRQREIEIRLAMGAGRGRIVRHLFTESLVLALAGGVAGAGVGVWLSGLMVFRLGDQFPPWVRFDIDGRLVLFTVIATAATAVLFGMFPALRLSRAQASGSFSTTTSRGTAGQRQVRATGMLVAGQIALACMLLVVTGVTLRDAQALQDVEPGFRTEGVLAYTVQLPAERYPTPAERVRFWTEHLERVEAVPGVVSAGATTILPLRGHSGYFFQAEGAPERADGEANPVVLVRAISPGYLETMGVQIVQGRALTASDGRDEGAGVVVVNETFAREFLGHLEEPVGARVRTGGRDWWTVVAVTADTKHYGLDEPMRPGVWVPLPQLPPSAMNIAVRSAGEPTRLTESLRAALTEQAPGVAMFRVTTMAEVMADALWARRASMWLMLGFAGAALLLAVAGLYGVVSYGVRQRVGEIGIRMAIGARRGQVARKVVRDGLVIVGAGTTLGLAVAFAVAPFLASALFTASPRDPWVFLGVLITVPAVAVAASVFPARRAASLDPMEVLRGE